MKDTSLRFLWWNLEDKKPIEDCGQYFEIGSLLLDYILIAVIQYFYLSNNNDLKKNNCSKIMYIS